jgi:hypothetical protein
MLGATINAVDVGYINRKGKWLWRTFIQDLMTANIPFNLACGIARSGAYNRTLTPFGFQVSNTQLQESPSVHCNVSVYECWKMKTPMLLVHGEVDNNPELLPCKPNATFKRGAWSSSKNGDLPKKSWLCS